MRSMGPHIYCFYCTLRAVFVVCWLRILQRDLFCVAVVTPAQPSFSGPWFWFGGQRHLLFELPECGNSPVLGGHAKLE